MMSTFSDMVKQILEVFIDDFSVFGKSYNDYLHNLENVFRRCRKKPSIKLGKVLFYGIRMDSPRP